MANVNETSVTYEPLPAGPTLLEARGLNVWFVAQNGERKHVVKGVDLALRAGQCVALVGESGSGKSVTARSLVGLAGDAAIVEADRLALGDETLLGRPDSWWRRVRGARIGFILQDALVSLDPLRPVGKEIDEALSLHGWGTRRARREKVLQTLGQVGVPEPALRARQRPGELSGGLRQRALIASAIALRPDIVIADEPTTALDVTVQAQVLAVLKEMLAQGTSVILISHDLAVVARLADTILVMKGGEIVESGPSSEVLARPKHPYTQTLIDAIPSEHTKGVRLSASRGALTERLFSPAEPRRAGDTAPLLEARDVVKSFRGPDGVSRTVVKGVSFSLGRGETLGIVGESGSGKSTLARIALSLETPDSGEVRFLGEPWSHAARAQQQEIRRRIAVVYQDPLSSFDPRWRVSRILIDAIMLGDPAHHGRARQRAAELLQTVGLTEAHLDQWPLRMSGGQRQRVAIARAIATSPEVIVLDEAVSALDVSIQAQILDLLSDLQARLGVSYLFISHDLGVIHHMSDRVLVMQNGIAVEQGTADEVFYAPRHSYTQTLLESLPRLEYARLRLAASSRYQHKGNPMSDLKFVWPQVPTDDFDGLAARFRPIFDQIRTGAVGRDRDRSLPLDAVALLRQSGFGALRVPKAYGGFGTSLTTLFALLTELAEADSNLSQILRGHFGFVEIVLHHEDKDWSHRWLTRAGEGDLFAPAHTEPGDSRHGSFATAVTGEGEQLRLNGTKYYTTGALYLDWMHVTAARGDIPVTVLVPTQADGVTVVDDWDGFGQALTASGTATYRDVRISEADVQPAQGRAAHIPAVYQLIHLATLSGIGRAAVRETTDYLAQRRRTYAHGNAAAAKDDAQILQVVGEVAAKVYGANVATLAAAQASQRFFDRLAANRATEDDRVRLEIEVYQAQVATANQILDATTALFGGLGASALSRDRGLDRFWRNARAISSHNPLIYRGRQIGDFLVNAIRPPALFSLPLPEADPAESLDRQAAE